MSNFEKDNKKRRHPELLIPAGSLEVLKIAVIYGADAVYIGGEAFGLRAKAKNFSLEEMAEGVEFAHEHNVKVYVTANILAHNRDLPGAREYFEELKQVKPDALIISDPAIFTIAKEILPDMEIHISTQANNTNYGTFNFWHGLGAKRVVTARELSLKEIKEIRKHIPEDACSAVSWRAGMPIRGHALIRAGGNIPWWKNPDRENICRFMKTSGELISLTRKIYV